MSTPSATQNELAIGSQDDGENLFLNHLQNKWGMTDDSKGPSGVGDEDAALRNRMLTKLEAEEDQPKSEERREEDEETPSEDGETQEGNEDDNRKYLQEDDDDNVYVKVKVGEVEQEVSISSLKRLHGQEAALTQRSQQLAETRKRLDMTEATNVAVSNAMLQHARGQLQPYAQLDFLRLARDPNVSPEQLEALRTEATERYNIVQFLEQQTGQFMQAITERQHTQMVTDAQAAVKEIRDPASQFYIDGWNQELYDDLRGFAVEQGLKPELVNSIVDPAAIKILRMAQMYANGKQALVKTVKKNNTVTKVTKTSKSMPDSARGPGGSKTKAMNRLVRSGSVDDAAEAFLANFSKYSE